jgi:hypothetical protein
LRRAANPQLHALLDSYDRELTTMRAAFVEHNVRWSPASVVADWHGYKAAAHAQIAALLRRMAWAEDRIYPQAVALRTASPDRIVTRSAG